MSRVLLLVAAALAFTTLAGCSGSGAPDPAGPGADLPDGLLLLRGVVIDPAIRPVTGAEVSIPARPGLAAVTTGEDGTFEFATEPGTVFVQVRRIGFLMASVQTTVEEGGAVVQVRLEPSDELRPYAVVESFQGFLDCGVGSGPAFGLTAGCSVVLGGTAYILCTGNGPVPPTGICLAQTVPYFVSAAEGANMSMAQTEVVWDPTVQGQSELLLGSYVVDRSGAIVGGVPSVSGQSVLVRRLNETVVQDARLGAANSLALFVNPGNSGPANVVVQQSYQLVHTSTFLFEPDADWTFARDGAPPVPDACTSCLR